METRFLGRTGLQVSELCLGTMTLGADGGTDEATAQQMLDAFVDAGGTFIDTANVYSQGVSEEILGRWLKTATATTWSSPPRSTARPRRESRREGPVASTCWPR
jgi:aryl-alcohol dehydrogenase-like predicted oxidoreductase